VSRTPGDLVILGTSGHAREVAAIADAAGFRVVGFVGPHREEETARLRAPWLGEDTWLDDAPPGVRYVLGIGSGPIRQRLHAGRAGDGPEAAILVHPAASLGPGITFGPGSVVWPGAVLTTDVAGGRHVHVNTNVAVGHDAVLGDFVTLLPGCTVGGSTRLDEAVTVGAGASVIDGVHLGPRSFVGAGAVVLRDVDAGTTVAGVPAAPLRSSGGVRP
jgi:sugar O-acyltransferase (sialic acid O-acetyltransferase NeuD family)